MTPEQIIPIALFVVVVLFNLVGRWLRSRMQAQQERQAEPEPPVRELPPPPRVRVATPLPPAAEERRPVRRGPARVARPPRRLLGKPEDVRRAVVLIAVFGPCRGFEPYGPDSVR